MENKRKLFRMVNWGGKTAIKEGFLVVAVGVVICICLDTWNQLPFLWSETSNNSEIGVHYYWFNSFIFGGFYTPHILPMLSCVPYATSYFEESSSNMIGTLISKSNIKLYCLSKVIVTALSGGLSLALGGSLFIFLTSRFTVLVDKATLIEYQWIPYFKFLQEGNGIKYFIIVIFLLFLSGMLWSSVGLLISAYINNRYVIYVTPLVISFLLVRVNVMLKVPDYLRLDFLLKGRSSFGTDIQSIFMTTFAVIILVTVFGYLFYKRVKKVIKGE